MRIDNIQNYEHFDLEFEQVKSELMIAKQNEIIDHYNAICNAINSNINQSDDNSIHTAQQWQSARSKLVSEYPWLEDSTLVIPNFIDQADIDILYINLKKQVRNKLVDEIQVTVNDKVFDGDETSQIRMTRAIQLLANDEDTITWVLADNEPVIVTKLELIEALQKSAAAQVSLWNIYQ